MGKPSRRPKKTIQVRWPPRLGRVVGGEVKGWIEKTYNLERESKWDLITN